MPRIRVNLYASLRRYGGGSPTVEMDIAPGTTVGQLLDELRIPSGETRILFVNHRAAAPDHTLTGGERVAVFPAIGGG